MDENTMRERIAYLEAELQQITEQKKILWDSAEGVSDSVNPKNMPDAMATLQRLGQEALQVLKRAIEVKQPTDIRI